MVNSFIEFIGEFLQLCRKRAARTLPYRSLRQDNPRKSVRDTKSSNTAIVLGQDPLFEAMIIRD